MKTHKIGRAARQFARSLQEEFGGDAEAWKDELERRRTTLKACESLGEIPIADAENAIALAADRTVIAIDLVLKTYDPDHGPLSRSEQVLLEQIEDDGPIWGADELSVEGVVS